MSVTEDSYLLTILKVKKELRKEEITCSPEHYPKRHEAGGGFFLKVINNEISYSNLLNNSGHTAV